MRIAAALFAGVLVLGTTAFTEAADLCLDDGIDTLVGKAFALPAGGTCREFRGFFLSSTPSSVYGAFGQACGSSDNHRIDGTLSFAGPSIMGSYTFYLDRSAAAGYAEICVANTGSSGSCELRLIRQVLCRPASVPIP